MASEITSTIEEYLADETKRYQAWYTELTQSGDSQYTTPVSVLPELSELKQLFETWIKQKESMIASKVCETYCMKKHELNDKKTLLIAAIADSLSFAFTGIPINVIAVVTILVTENYLDRICECN